ncbi:hypothetical protein I0C86_09815 [Plantactinospora sp. S1510]|uniref:Uncharacterized protein n=1 Tax=Plantactinospora alkalitolerans TaxID=2789879 RepID=A0ABS0GT96_9ACTN|nr:hypothetical protein [Plantactinospora alkalitolerans]MBF9129269.1 hypothetical protein [Plantactinospora alkalitolerans]
MGPVAPAAGAAGSDGPRRRRWGLWLAALLVVSAAGAGLYGYARGGGTAGYSCVVVHSSGDDAGRQRALELCHRQQRDRARRAPISSPGPIGYEGTAEIMHGAVSRSSWCPAPGDPRCYEDRSGRAATAVDVAAAERALSEAGLAGSVVRVARPDDPAPDGALVFALQMGDGCVVGYLDVGSGDGDHLVGGLLPNGECLES